MIKIQNDKYKLLKVIPVINEHEDPNNPSKRFYELNKGIDEEGNIIAFPTGAGDELADSNGDLYLVVNKEYIYGQII